MLATRQLKRKTESGEVRKKVFNIYIKKLSSEQEFRLNEKKDI